MTSLPRDRYAALYGPTRGDRVRLADTDLVVEIERDLTWPGDEVVFGGGKTLRDGQGQSTLTRAEGALDLVITNAIVLDPLLGVLKADIGVRDGRIVGVGKAGNPATMEGVGADLVVRPGTEAIPGEHLIATPGCTSGLPALPMAAMRCPRRPMSALTMPQWSRISALVMTVSAAPCLLVTWD